MSIKVRAMEIEQLADTGRLLIKIFEGSGVNSTLEVNEIEARQLADLLTLQIGQSIPTVEMQHLVDSGLNAFALQLFAESVANKKDAKTFRPFSFKFRNIRITLEPAGEIDTRHH